MSIFVDTGSPWRRRPSQGGRLTPQGERAEASRSGVAASSHSSRFRSLAQNREITVVREHSIASSPRQLSGDAEVDE